MCRRCFSGLSSLGGGKGGGWAEDDVKRAWADICHTENRYTLDAATDFLLGTSVDSLRNSQAEFAEAFAEVQRVQNIIARAG